MQESQRPVQTPTGNEDHHHSGGYNTTPSRRGEVHHERPLYRTASPSKPRPHERDDYIPGSYHSPDGRSLRRDSNDGPHSNDSLHSRIPVSHKLSYDSADSTPKNAKTPLATTPYSYAQHAASNDDSPMWLSATKETSSYNPKHYEDSLTDTRFNQNSSPGVNRIGDGAEHPESES